MIMRSNGEQNSFVTKARERWNEIYKEGGNRLEVTLYIEREIQEVLDFLKVNNVKRVLDLGCGAGRCVIYLVQNGFEVFGIDISEEGIRKAKERLKERNLTADLRIGSIYNTLPYEDNFFDAVISIKTIYHGTIEDIRKTIKEIERVLKPGGLVFITAIRKKWRKPYPHYKEIAPRTYVPMEGEERGVPHYYFNKKLLRKEFGNFHILRIWISEGGGYYYFLGKVKK